MIASLYQRSFWASGCTSICDITFTRAPSRFATEQQRGIAGGIDGEPHAAPFDGVALAGDEIDDGAHRFAVAVRADHDVAEVEPDAAGLRGQRDCDRDRVVARDGFLDEA